MNMKAAGTQTTKKTVDFSEIKCYSTENEITKEAVKVINRNFYFYYYFDKGCPSFVEIKA